MLRKIELMYSFFGIDNEKRQCKECSHFKRYMYRDKYYRKCDIYGDTSSEASDWSGKYISCGMFNKEYKGKAIINFVKRSSGNFSPEEPIEGQISFEEDR